MTTSRPRSRPRSRPGRRPGARSVPPSAGSATLPTPRPSYCDHLLAAVPVSLAGLHVVVDCANGSASFVAPDVYRRAGATVTVIAADPDGLNINDGVGSTHIDGLAQAVVAAGADLGIAHDGDADRCLAVSADGDAGRR